MLFMYVGIYLLIDLLSVAALINQSGASRRVVGPVRCLVKKAARRPGGLSCSDP